MPEPALSETPNCKPSGKDNDRRELPLVDRVAQLLIDIQTELLEDQQYLVLRPQRYQHLMKLALGEDCMADVTHFAPFLPKSSGLDGGATGKCNRIK